MDDDSRHPQPAPRRSSRLRWLGFLLLIMIAAGVYLYWPKLRSAASGSPKSLGAAKKGGKGGRGDGAATTPVVGSRVQKGNIGVYFNGLGSVTPLSTVTIKSRVDGELMTAHFREGDTVQKGDLLMEIDPRPYQVQLTQAEGQLMRDQANLENART